MRIFYDTGENDYVDSNSFHVYQGYYIRLDGNNGTGQYKLDIVKHGIPYTLPKCYLDPPDEYKEAYESIAKDMAREIAEIAGGGDEE